MESIQITPYETSDPNLLGCVIHCQQQKVSCSKGLIICADKSGSMHDLMDDSNPKSFMQTPQTQQNYRNMPKTPLNTRFSNFYNNSGINPASRLGCVQGFLERIIDMYEFLQTTQGLSQELTIILFDESCDVFSTIDACSYTDMKHRVNQSLRHNGGTNFDVALKTIEKYRKMSQGDVEIIFLSDGSHCDNKITKEYIVNTYQGYVDLAIGIGERGVEYDEATLRAISKEFVIGESSKRIRDVVADRALGIVTMLGSNLVMNGSINISNMNKTEDSYTWPEMSMLMELYFTVSRNSITQFSYKLQNGEKIIKDIDFSNVEVNEDKPYGDKVVFCLEALQKLEMAKQKTTELSLLEKVAYLEKVKKEIHDSEHLDSFKDTRLGVYLQQLLEQLDKILITRDEKKFLDLAENIQKDAYRSTSAIRSQTYFSSQKSMSAVYSSSNKCVICGDDNATREVVYVPCGHFMTCSSCSVEWNKHSKCCPYCNQKVTGCIFVELTAEQKSISGNMHCPSCHVRRVNLVSENCKHAFSCSNCVAKEKASVGSVCCKLCNSNVDKVIRIYI
jgi:hypothetical protein